MSNQINYGNLLEESRKVFAKSILCEHVSKRLTETLLLIEDKMNRELTKDEIENILILLTDENDI
jgi:hypothetical protein